MSRIFFFRWLRLQKDFKNMLKICFYAFLLRLSTGVTMLWIGYNVFSYLKQ